MTAQARQNHAVPRKLVFLLSWRLGIIKSKLPPTTRHLLLTLSVHMDGSGRNCFPGIERLCDETGLSRRAIINHLRLAKESGWLSIAKRGMPGKKWAHNEYSATLPPSHKEGGALGALPPVIQVVHLVQEGSAPDDAKAVHVVHPNSSVELINEVVCSAGKPAPCPRDELFRLWNECVPSCPHVSEISWSPKNQRHMERCWRKKPDLSWWADLFAKIANTPRLTGVDEIRPGRGLFWATLRWLVVESNFSDVVDGIYSVDARPKNRRT